MRHPIKLDDSFRRAPTQRAENALTNGLAPSNANHDMLSTHAGDEEIE